MNFIVSAFSDELECLKDMPNGGLVPKDQAAITRMYEDDGTKKVVITSRVPTDETPVFSSFKIENQGDTKEVRYTPLDKTGKPIGPTRVFPVTDLTKPIENVFDEPIVADQLGIEFVPLTPGEFVESDIDYCVACMPLASKFLQNMHINYWLFKQKTLRLC